MDRETAQIYQDFFVPALFGEWAEKVADAAAVRPGERVLDVACGTGALTRAVKARAGEQGRVVGVDLSEGMLSVARDQGSRGVTFDLGSALELPYETSSFDVVVSQFGLMFFDDRALAVGEMLRVLVPGGRMAVAVWDSVDNAPGYRDLIALLDRLFGAEAGDALRAPFCLGEAKALGEPFRTAGAKVLGVSTLSGKARFPSIESWIHTDVRGWSPVGDLLSDADFDRLVGEASRSLADHVVASGEVEFDIAAHIVSARKTP